VTIVRTSLHTVESARRLRFEPASDITATDVQEAIEGVRAAVDSSIVAALAIDVQAFIDVGVWNWTKPAHGRFALVQIVGAAGGGARRSSGNGSGGGAGYYHEQLFLLSVLSATETVTIGAGGAVQSTDSTDGNPGDNTSFGSYITVYGGRGGQQAAAGTALSGGGSGTFWDPWAAVFSNASGFVTGQQPVAAGGGVSLTTNNPNAASASGTSAANAVQTIAYHTLFGGGGGAGHSTTGPASGVAAISAFAGSGGAGNGAGAGGNGASPGGGGGSGTTQGGSGGDGRIIVTVF